MKNNFMEKLKGNKNLLKLSIIGLVSALSLHVGFTFNVKATVSPKPSATAIQTSESPEKDKAAKDTGAAKNLEEKNQTVVNVPRFVPTPTDTSNPEERKNILIVGAHPDEERWKEWWEPLSKKYNLTFLQNDLPISFESSEDKIVIERDEILGDVACTSDKHVEVWKLDFNEEGFGEKMTQLVGNGKTFDLVINDYSVYKFFSVPCEVTTTLVNLVKPNGHCVLGSLNGGIREIIRPFQTNCVSFNRFYMHSLSIWMGKNLINISWNIGNTEADKQEIFEQLKDIKDPALIKVWQEQIEKVSKEITIETATASVNEQLQKLSFGKEINPIQPVLAGNIQSQLNEILPPDIYSCNSPTSMWMVVSPKQD